MKYVYVKRKCSRKKRMSFYWKSLRKFKDENKTISVYSICAYNS